MNFTVIFCCFVLLPYFASFVAPPQEATTCSAGVTQWVKHFARIICGPKIKVPAIKPNRRMIPNLPKLVDNWFEQNVDHYHITNLETWKQRYLLNDKYYDNKGPIFLLIGAQNDISNTNMQSGRWIEYAKEVHALIVGIEIRFYGQSVPNRDFSTQNLQYLNIEQALADVAWFIINFRSIEKIKNKIIFPDKSKWVVYGTFEEGNIATWMKLKFPHLIDVAFSLSAPLLAKANYNEYFKNIESLLNKEPSFKDAIKKAYEEINEYLIDSKYHELEEIYQFCPKERNGDDTVLLKDKKNIDFMYFTFAQIIASVIQYSKGTLKDIKNEAVIVMTDMKKKEYKNLKMLERFSVVVQMVKNEPGCLTIDYERAINGYKNTDLKASDSIYFPLPLTLGNRSYLYQCCTEFGYFETFENKDDFFKTKNSLTFYVDICTEVFGKQFNESFLEKGVQRTNLFYGGLDIIISHAVFVYAELDPLSKLGLTHPKTKDSVSITLEGAYECDELDSVNYVPHINEIKEKIINQIKEWLK